MPSVTYRAIALREREADLRAADTPQLRVPPGADWTEHAACRGTDMPEAFFPDERNDHLATNITRAYCDRCPVRTPCRDLRWDLRAQGVWAGVNYPPSAMHIPRRAGEVAA